MRSCAGWKQVATPAGAQFRCRENLLMAQKTLRGEHSLSFLHPFCYHVERPCKSARIKQHRSSLKIRKLSCNRVPTAVSSGANYIDSCSLDFSRTTSPDCSTQLRPLSPTKIISYVQELHCRPNPLAVTRDWIPFSFSNCPVTAKPSRSSHA